MILSDVFSDPLGALIRMERYVNNGSPSGFGVEKCVSLATSPFGPGSFPLPIYFAESGSVATAGDLTTLPSVLRPHDTGIPYPVHPDICESLAGSLPSSADNRVQVVPSASARTVLFCSDSDPIWIKLHYPLTIGRFIRDIPDFKWQSSFEKNDEIRAAIDRPGCPPHFAMLEEYGGVLLKTTGNHTSGAGVIYRRFNPYPNREQVALVPVFSLFATDRLTPSDPPLLVQILREHAGNPLDALLQFLICPLLECFRFLALDLGLIPEYNAQNVLLEVPASLEAPRIVHRDMMEPFVDFTLRRQLGLHNMFTKYHYIDLTDAPAEYYRRRSFEYDFKLGMYIFAELESLMHSHFALPRQVFRLAIKDRFRAIVTDDPEAYFGGTAWYSYPNSLLQGARPYQKRRSPRYR